MESATPAALQDTATVALQDASPQSSWELERAAITKEVAESRVRGKLIKEKTFEYIYYHNIPAEQISWAKITPGMWGMIGREYTDENCESFAAALVHHILYQFHKYKNCKKRAKKVHLTNRVLWAVLDRDRARGHDLMYLDEFAKIKNSEEDLAWWEKSDDFYCKQHK
jgi:hypothetical protein